MKKTVVKRTTRKSALQLRLIKIGKGLAWAWERLVWMLFGAGLMAFAMWVWR